MNGGHFVPHGEEGQCFMVGMMREGKVLNAVMRWAPPSIARDGFMGIENRRR